MTKILSKNDQNITLSKWQERVSIIARINRLVHLEYGDYMYKNDQNIVKE